MNLALILTAGAMGLAGAPHCTAMCGAACGALTRGGSAGAFQGGRLLSYAAAGAIAASSVAAVEMLARWAPALRPLWLLIHLAALALGLWLLSSGRIPGWLGAGGFGRSAACAPLPGGWRRISGPARSATAGLLWVAWPCGLLQSALLIAALADSPWTGAAAMAAFAVASSTGLWLGPALWVRLAGGRQTLADGAALSGWTVRLAGLGLVAASGWALGHGLWQRALAWCFG